MQLFITEFEKKGNLVKIDDVDILNQVRRVLRMKKGDVFFVQNDNMRYKLQIEEMNDKNIYGNIIDVSEYKQLKNQNGFLIAMSNKREKMELIVQKLSEIGVKYIYFWPSERSIIRKRNDKKLKRLNKISKEAVEQSRGWFLPEIDLITDITEIIEGSSIIVFDKINDFHKKTHQDIKEKGKIIGVVGPEGGLSPIDYKKFGDNYEIVSLGNTILRTETAAIIAARNIMNLYNF